MTYNKTFLCLADSRKLSGRCIAGKELVGGTFQNWIRPVSARPTEEISVLDRRYVDGDMPTVLDIIKVQLIEPRPHLFQRENHLIDDSEYWEKTGRGTWAQLNSAIDTTTGPLWNNGDSSYNGMNDQIAINTANALTSSLMLVKTDELELQVGMEGPPTRRKRKVRAKFQLGGVHYWLTVTDFPVEARYLRGQDGSFEVGEAILGISLSEPFNGYTYKLAAAVFLEQDFA